MDDAKCQWSDLILKTKNGTGVSVLGIRKWLNILGTYLHSACDILKQPCSTVSEASQSATSSNIYSHDCFSFSLFLVFCIMVVGIFFD